MATDEGCGIALTVADPTRTHRRPKNRLLIGLEDKLKGTGAHIGQVGMSGQRLVYGLTRLRKKKGGGRGSGGSFTLASAGIGTANLKQARSQH